VSLYIAKYQNLVSCIDVIRTKYGEDSVGTGRNKYVIE